MKRFGLKATVLAAAVALGSLAGCSRHEGPRQQVTVKGSDTMVHLVSSWAEAFMKANPGSEVSVTGGGSGTGIAALINGTTDLCASSRDMKESEKVEVRAKGVEPGEVVVGLDGIAVIVNPANPANELTMEQVKKIFNGAVTSWRQLGGPDQPIVVLSRESSSGTYVFFKEHVLGKDDYTPAARLMPATSSIIQSVSTDTWAVGYVGLGYAAEAGAKVKMLRVKAKESSPAVTPSEATVKSGEYAIARPLFLYTRGEPVGAAQAFVEYSLSVEGQSIVRATGYVTVK